MPGHKRNKNFIGQDLLNLDMTEIDGLDNLQNPNGIIKDAQENCAKIFGCHESFFVVNGASSAVMSAIFSVCNEHDEIIAMRNSHKSFYNALELSGVRAHYLYGKNFWNAINYGELENLLRQKSKVKAVFITSPNYEGFCLDVKKISQLTHQYKKILIVDESHGSHFIFHEKFPLSAIKSGADIVINSLHKTLPCLTQSAVLHVNSNLIDTERVKKYLAMFQTSSPSYIFMSIIDSTLKKISQPNFFDKYVKKLEDVRNILSNNKIIHLANKFDVKNFGFNDLDISKLTFFVNSNINAEKILRDKFSIQIEMQGLNHFIALTSIADTDLGFEKLIHAINYLEKNCEYKKLNFEQETPVKLKTAFSVKQTNLKSKQYIELEKSLNKISADYITVYPPGIPLIIPGEIISQEIIESVKNYMNKGINVLGVKENFVAVVEH